MRVVGQETPRIGADIGEIAPPAARDQDLLPGFLGMVDDQHPRTALPRRCRAQQPSPSGSEDDDIEFHGRLLGRSAGREKAGSTTGALFQL